MQAQLYEITLHSKNPQLAVEFAFEWQIAVCQANDAKSSSVTPGSTVFTQLVGTESPTENQSDAVVTVLDMD